MGYDLLPLRLIIKDEKDEKDAQARLDTFECSRNRDLEQFLHRNAIANEKRELTRTYLAVSPDNRILGYFSLNLRCGIVPPGSVSTNLYKKLNVQEDTDVAQMYLIAQLGRDDHWSVPGFGKELMVEAINIIREARDRVGCRVVRLDCRPDPHLVAYYNGYGFQEIKRDTNGDELVMMVMILRDKYDWEPDPDSTRRGPNRRIGPTPRTIWII